MEEEDDDGEDTPGAMSFRKMRLLDDQAEVSGEEGEDEEDGENEYVADGVFLVNDDDESEDEDAPAGYRARTRYRTLLQSQPTQHTRYRANMYLPRECIFGIAFPAKRPKKQSKNFTRLRRARSTADIEDMEVIQESRKRPRDDESADEVSDDNWIINDDEESANGEEEDDEHPQVTYLPFSFAIVHFLLVRFCCVHSSLLLLLRGWL